MASELEESAEVAHELIKEEIVMSSAAHSKWVEWVALLTMVMALLSAVGALLIGMTSNELMLERTKQLLYAAHLDSDRVDMEILKSKHAILAALGKDLDQSEVAKISKYQRDIETWKAEVESEKVGVATTLFEHELFAIGVTLLSIAITLSGMAVVTKRHKVWAVGLFFAAVGASFVGFGVYTMLS